MRRILLLSLCLIAIASPIQSIEIVVQSGKAVGEVTLRDGRKLPGRFKLPKEKAKSVKVTMEEGDTVIRSEDIEYIEARSVKYDDGPKYVLRHTAYYEKPGGKVSKPVWMIKWAEGPHCDMWSFARNANFGIGGEVSVKVNELNPAVELYWKKDVELPTYIRTLGDCEAYFSDDKVITEKIRVQREPPFYMTDQIKEYVPGREK